jgi:signal transduction histidine kinase
MPDTPDTTNHPRTAALVVAGWTAFALFFASQSMLADVYAGRPVAAARSLTAWLTCAYVWAALTPLVVGLARRFPLSGAGWPRSVAVHAAAGLGVTFVQLVAYEAIRQLTWGSTPAGVTPLGAFWRLVVVEAHSGFAIYWSIAGIAHAIETSRAKRRRELEASRLETLLATVRLDALRMQLHPHFLFNTLNTISVLMRRDVDAANRMLVRLSGLLRVALANSDSHEVALRDELEFLRNYLEIERTRFHDRLSVRIEADPATLDARVPNLILQPLVENAIKHGVAPRSTAGVVEVSAARRDGSVELTVRDNGPGLPPGGGRAGIGIANTRARLEGLYGPASHLELADAPGGGAVVTVSIPFRS